MAVFAGLTLLAGLIRLPFLSHIAADEAYYLTVGRQWLEGSMPYAGAFDVKPPGLFALMALAEAIFGPAAIASKALCIAASGAAAFGTYLIARRLAGEIAGLAAALLYTASSLALSRSNTNAELLMAPFAVFGMLAALRAILDGGRARIAPLFAAGLWFGAAASIKQTALFEAMPLLAMVLLRSAAGWRGAAAFAAGTAAVPTGFALYYLACGQLGPLFADAVVLALRRANAENTSRGQAWLEFLSAGVDFLPAALLASLLWFKRRRLRSFLAHAGLVQPAARSHPYAARSQANFRPPGCTSNKDLLVRLIRGKSCKRQPQMGQDFPRGVLALLAAWTAGALLGAAAAGGGLYFYYLPLLPPLCIAGGLYIGAVQGCASSASRRHVYRALTIAAVLLYTARIMAGISFPPAESRQAAEAAAAIVRNANSPPHAGVLAADAGVYIYIAAGATPPGPVFHPRQLLCETGFPAAAAALTDALNRKPSFIAAANPPLVRACEIPERRALLEARLASDYCRLSDAQAALSVYGLKEGGLCGQTR